MDNELKILKMIDLCTGKYVSKSIKKIFDTIFIPKKVAKK
jgi:hypothetical protein